MLNRIMSETVLASLKHCLTELSSGETENASLDFKANLDSAFDFCKQLELELKGLIEDYDKIKQELYDLKKDPDITEKSRRIRRSL